MLFGRKTRFRKDTPLCKPFAVFLLNIEDLGCTENRKLFDIPSHYFDAKELILGVPVVAPTHSQLHLGE